jgi:hypothetical protein
MTMPPPEPLRGAELASFRTETQRALAKIRTVENIVFPDALDNTQQRLAAALGTKPSQAKPRSGG